MPVPFIPLVAVGVAAVVTAIVAVVTPNLPKKLKGKRVAILGAQQVGKTTLLQYLERGTLPASPAERTVDPKRGSWFELDIEGSKVIFDVPKDVPGNQDLGFHDWREAVQDAHYVWYLFRADLIAIGDLVESQRVRTHLGMLTNWIDGAEPHAPKIVLLGTHADMHPSCAGDL